MKITVIAAAEKVCGRGKINREKNLVVEKDVQDSIKEKKNAFKS